MRRIIQTIPDHQALSLTSESNRNTIIKSTLLATVGIVILFGMLGCTTESLTASESIQEPVAKPTMDATKNAPMAEPECVYLWDEASQSKRLDCPDPLPPQLVAP
jgi:hypothetical protein